MDLMYRVEEIWSNQAARENILVFCVVRRTKCGAWIRPRGWDTDVLRFVKSSSRKRYAYPTLVEARRAFRFRKERQVAILSAQLERAQHALKMGRELEKLKDSERLLSHLLSIFP